MNVSLSVDVIARGRSGSARNVELHLTGSSELRWTDEKKQPKEIKLVGNEREESGWKGNDKTGPVVRPFQRYFVVLKS